MMNNKLTKLLIFVLLMYFIVCFQDLYIDPYSNWITEENVILQFKDIPKGELRFLDEKNWNGLQILYSIKGTTVTIYHIGKYDDAE